MTKSWLVGLGALGLMTAQAAAAQTDSPSGAQDPQAADMAAGESPADCRAGGEVITFKVDSDTLDTKAKTALENVKGWLEEDENRQVRLEGFTDPSGPSLYNEQLSERRASAAQQYLVAQGVGPDRILADGRGEAPADNGLQPKQRSVIVLYCETPAEAAAALPTEEETTTEVVAAEPLPPPEPMPPTQDITTAPPAPQGPLSRIGFGLSVGGGAVGFVDQEAREQTDIGGDWEARLVIGTRLPVAAEVAYVGSAQSIEGVGIGPDALLMSNGVEGGLRLQLPEFFVQPYALVGVGWVHYYLSNTDGQRGLLRKNDDVLTMPLGVGISFRTPFGALFDLRGIYRPTWNDDLMDGVVAGTGKTADLTIWSANARLGWEF